MDGEEGVSEGEEGGAEGLNGWRVGDKVEVDLPVVSFGELEVKGGESGSKVRKEEWD